jgi:hypothetical protein
MCPCCVRRCPDRRRNEVLDLDVISVEGGPDQLFGNHGDD